MEIALYNLYQKLDILHNCNMHYGFWWISKIAELVYYKQMQ